MTVRVRRKEVARGRNGGRNRVTPSQVRRLLFNHLRNAEEVDAFDFAGEHGLPIRNVQRALEDFQRRGWLQRAE